MGPTDLSVYDDVVAHGGRDAGASFMAAGMALLDGGVDRVRKDADELGHGGRVFTANMRNSRSPKRIMILWNSFSLLRTPSEGNLAATPTWTMFASGASRLTSAPTLTSF